MLITARMHVIFDSGLNNRSGTVPLSKVSTLRPVSTYREAETFFSPLIKFLSAERTQKSIKFFGCDFIFLAWIITISNFRSIHVLRAVVGSENFNKLLKVADERTSGERKLWEMEGFLSPSAHFLIAWLTVSCLNCHFMSPFWGEKRARVGSVCWVKQGCGRRWGA